MFKSDSEFLQFAISKYDNPQLSSVAEFEADLRRFTYVNNLVNRYSNDISDLQDRLIINHLVILSNCFTPSGLVRMLSYKIPSKNITIINTFLYYLNIIDKTSVDLDFYLLDILDDQ